MELAKVIARINARPKQAINPFLIQDENGQPLTQGALRSRFDKARTLANVDFQFRDIRGRAAKDTGNLAHSQKLLGHKNRDMTEHYVKARMGGGLSRFDRVLKLPTLVSRHFREDDKNGSKASERINRSRPYLRSQAFCSRLFHFGQGLLPETKRHRPA